MGEPHAAQAVARALAKRRMITRLAVRPFGFQLELRVSPCSAAGVNPGSSGESKMADAGAKQISGEGTELKIDGRTLSAGSVCERWLSRARQRRQRRPLLGHWSRQTTDRPRAHRRQ
ncbi:hypothetical protein PoB_002664900 [Plakobranchus ocellatus]|uniref:Uncharacterized protein n=1 Tax=Plakobranchus ocellatus TaxID=259542 RepID=A0AAV4A0M7_9GAST|nr:hypothetical protein PoB_002664900 [Plakobranchus ocellatus]